MTGVWTGTIVNVLPELWLTGMRGNVVIGLTVAAKLGVAVNVLNDVQLVTVISTVIDRELMPWGVDWRVGYSS